LRCGARRTPPRDNARESLVGDVVDHAWGAFRVPWTRAHDRPDMAREPVAGIHPFSSIHGKPGNRQNRAASLAWRCDSGHRPPARGEWHRRCPLPAGEDRIRRPPASSGQAVSRPTGQSSHGCRVGPVRVAPRRVRFFAVAPSLAVNVTRREPMARMVAIRPDGEIYRD